MLAPQVEAPFADDFFELALLGRAEHRPMAERLMDEVGLDVEYRRTGILRVARTEAERADLQRQLRWQSGRGLAAEWVDSDDLGRREPLLSGVAGRLLAGGLWLPDEGQVRSPRLVQALAMGAVRHGAHLLEGTWATGLCVSGVCKCPPYYSFCGGTCIFTADDPNNCGDCSIVSITAWAPFRNSGSLLKRASYRAISSRSSGRRNARRPKVRMKSIRQSAPVPFGTHGIKWRESPRRNAFAATRSAAML